MPGILAQHLADLRNSGLSDAQIIACRFTSLTDHQQVAGLLGWKTAAKHLAPCWAVSFPAPDGSSNGYVRIKPDKPRTRNGELVKYESPYKKGNRAFFPPGTLAVLANPSVPLAITEGEKKAAAGDQHGFPSVGLVGVDGWSIKRTDKSKPRELIKDLAAIVWRGRIVYIIFDSDIVDKPEVERAEWALAEALTAKGAVVKVVRLPAAEKGEKAGLDDFLIARGADGLRRLLEAAKPAEKPKDPRPKVVLGPWEHLCVEEAVRALVKDAHLYQRGGQLVRVAFPIRPEAAVNRTTATAKIEPVPLSNLRIRLARYANIVEVRQKNGEVKEDSAHPPDWLVKAVGTLGSWPGIRPLESVVTTPTLLADGSVVQEPGYHAGAGLLYLPDGEFPSIPEAPSRSDALRAIEVLLEVVCDFPFVKEEHRSAWLAALLTLVGRFAFHGPAPLFLIDANVRAAGKGVLADCIAIIVFGRVFGRTAYPDDDNEMRKLILSMALEGERAVLLDNLSATLGCPSLDAALTATEWEGRILCTNTKPRLPLMATWLATGNNVLVLADTGRRVCHVRLESPDERPEERTDFRHPDLLAWVRQDRPRLLTAALTILAAYCKAGRADQRLKEWGSFEGWTKLIRGALVWCGLADPGDTREGLRAKSDRDADAVRGLIEGWRELDADGEGKTVNKALNMLKDKANEQKYMTLREVLGDLFDLTVGKLPTPSKLGYLLRRYRGRNVGGLCLDAVAGHGNVQVWRVRSVETGARPAGGHGGDGWDGGDKSTAPGRDDSPSPAAAARQQTAETSPPSPPSPPPRVEEGEL